MSSSARRRAAFDVYVGLGPGRSITAVFLELSSNRQKYGFRRVPSVRTLETWSAEDGWVARVTELEIEASRSDSVRHLEVVQGHRERVVRQGLLLQQVGTAALSLVRPQDIKAGDAIRAISEGIRIEALALGFAVPEPGKTGSQGNGQPNERHMDLSKLTDEELDFLEHISQKIPE